ncbi:transglutaminase family protein [Anatilimnocola floriformis]|uniref:transglutaminase family protein n=1 Tax=Anatilimnocola floriformis TaxID=2948575 RepID=UPI0020C47210|nr:transglutaminase family protein [Anatilimnocola floriformis]
MAIRVALHHRTSYRFDRPVTLLPHVVRLRPAPHCRTPILSYSLKVQPEEQFLNWQQDPYSNYLARLVFPKPATEAVFEVDLVAEMTTHNPFDFFIDDSAQQSPFKYDAILTRELQPYLEAEAPGPLLSQLIAESRKSAIKTIDYLVELNQKIQSRLKYLIRLEPGIQSCEETLTLGSGSCRDYSWLLVNLLRHLGLAARFVSGYLIQLTADVKSLDGPSGTEVDFTDLHAWTEVFIPGAGWIGLDSTSGLLAGEGHLPLACAADPTSAAPITGSWQKLEGDTGDVKVEQEFKFEMKVTRIHEDPRVTKPYTDRQWNSIETLGAQIDDELRAGDCRLTMGGEPTFVAIDNRDADEWNTAALGPHKRKLAGVLFRKMRDHFAPQGLLHFSQGKWYPGESLPRWAFSCYWRKDGQPLWRDPALVAADHGEYKFTDRDAQKFTQVLARRLGVEAGHEIPGYEDVWYYMWRERRLPTNVDPLQNNLADKEERARLAKIFDHGLEKVIGYALPVQRIHTREGSYWVSGSWFLRREHMFLIPGDSPMGFRLPLDSIPWVAPGDMFKPEEIDPTAPLPPLPSAVDGNYWSPQSGDLLARYNPPYPNQGYPNQSPRSIWEQNFGPGAGPGNGSANGRGNPNDRRGETLVRFQTQGDNRPEPGKSAAGIVRTALCVESRNGTMFVFMPPLGLLEDYLDLVAAIEATANELNIPVQLEGYGPPHDSRLQNFSVTPDPGVIEVNIHPATNWEELAANTEALYQLAHESRLSAEKFMLDGKHTGTGGGNHIVIGGPTPTESPILQRPDLLRSLVSYWHNHPSLSYLFSGLFLGPTSQAPRVDEARNDSLYELEIAFQELRLEGNVKPWLVDRVFRHLLTDLTGNTHRAEFCIDKLYSPDGYAGRRGLLEMRAFEMPPHWQMSLVQQLLLRSLIARFWHEPYRAKLVRWGTELHDRFALPHFIQHDLQDVLYELRQAGFPLQEAWFAPHLEFRFPLLGEISQRNVKLELRQAIEPWHVLGEESSSSGTARYVDSSVERLQVKVTGLTDSRHVIACNGRRVPLHPTGVNGEFVAGVRYRAWQPPSCLHPTIGSHAPLVFDLLDTWLNRSIGGCTYHVAHPGGMSYDTFPVNANAAEGRRHSRFLAMGHTPGSGFVMPTEERIPEAPLTLDLRTTPTMQQDLIAPDLQNGAARYLGNGSVANANLQPGMERKMSPSGPFRSRLSAAFEGERYD